MADFFKTDKKDEISKHLSASPGDAGPEGKEEIPEKQNSLDKPEKKIAQLAAKGVQAVSVANQEAKDIRVVDTSKRTFFDLLKSQRKQIEMALPKHMDVDRLIRVAMTALSKNPKLGQCTQTSLLGSIIQASQLGLEPNTPLGHSYLVPFYNKDKKCHEVQLITGYRGLVDLANRTGRIDDIVANPVYTNDSFEYEYGLNHFLKHKPSKNENGELECFYAYCHIRGGGFHFVVMSLKQVEAIRLRSKSGSDEHGNPSFIWKSDYIEMGCKTAVRKLSKMLPMSIEFAKAIEHDGTRPDPVSMDLENLSESGEFVDKNMNVEE